MTEITIGGRRTRFIASTTAPGAVQDTGEANPHVPDSPIFVMGYDDAPSDDPAERFRARENPA